MNDYKEFEAAGKTHHDKPLLLGRVIGIRNESRIFIIEDSAGLAK